eukprot:4393416-Ditylum_brightwellii.AAC.1
MGSTVTLGIYLGSSSAHAVPHQRNGTIPVLWTNLSQVDSFPPGNPESTTWDFPDDVQQAPQH